MPKEKTLQNRWDGLWLTDWKLYLGPLSADYQIPQLIQFLLELDAKEIPYQLDVNKLLDLNRAPIHVAIARKNRDLLASLLKLPNIDPNRVSCTMGTPLQLAADSEEATLLLLATPGINVLLATPSGSALHFAVLANNVTTVQLLLQNGNPTKICNASGQTALMLALTLNKREVVPLLISRFGGGSIINDSLCLLTALISYGFYQLAEEILLEEKDYDTNVDKFHERGKSPLQMADALLAGKPNPAVSKLFALMIPKSKVVDAEFYSKRLYIAAVRDDQVVINALMKIPAVDPNKRYPDKTALEIAQYNGYTDSVALLKRSRIHNHSDLIKKLLEGQFVRTYYRAKEDSLLEHIVLCDGYRTPKIESAALNLAQLVFSLEWGCSYPSPKKLLNEIIADAPQLMDEFINAIRDKKYPHPFSKPETVKKFAAVIYEVMKRKVVFPIDAPVQKPVDPLATIANEAKGSTPVAVAAAVPVVSQVINQAFFAGSKVVDGAKDSMSSQKSDKPEDDDNDDATNAKAGIEHK